MKKTVKTFITGILVCLLIAGSALSTSAACGERVIYYGGNSVICGGNADDCQSGSDCPTDCTSLYDLLKQYGCTEKSCRNICEMLQPYGCAHPTEACAEQAPAETATEIAAPKPEPVCPAAPSALPTQAPIQQPTQAPVQQPTQAPVQQPTQAPAPKPTQAPVSPTEAQQPAASDNSALSAYEREVVVLVNEIRAENGLNPLRINEELSRVARIKSQDMHDRNYFSHTSPTYGSPFDMMTAFGIRYRTAGENIAMGYRTPQAVVEGWMNSEGHRRNILNPSFTEIGVGYVESGHYWTQQFIG